MDVPSPADYEIWGSIVSFHSGIRAKPRPQTHFRHILGHRTLLIKRKMLFFLPNVSAQAYRSNSIRYTRQIQIFTQIVYVNIDNYEFYRPIK